ncbi:MAG: hypothetical protein DMF60_13500 [Acidobacteria bacterium]|nr:MAG: hypothetical protein DMF60_13500 [Acidobacteriota bacterium]
MAAREDALRVLQNCHPVPILRHSKLITLSPGNMEVRRVLSNLALSCLHCNVRKGPNIAGIDSATGEVTRLFNPRTDVWRGHFVLEVAELRGVTAIGRVTIHVLGMNEGDFVDVRSALIEEQTFAE